ncbi:MAG: hypothetical protein ABI200_00125 [Gaiellales bacterium]
MHGSDEAAQVPVAGAGLCNTCTYQRIIVSGRGSAFSLCRRAATDPAFARYPGLPVLACDGYEAVGEAAPGGEREAAAEHDEL